MLTSASALERTAAHVDPEAMQAAIKGQNEGEMALEVSKYKLSRLYKHTRVPAKFRLLKLDRTRFAAVHNT